MSMLCFCLHFKSKWKFCILNPHALYLFCCIHSSVPDAEKDQNNRWTPYYLTQHSCVFLASAHAIKSILKKAGSILNQLEVKCEFCFTVMMEGWNRWRMGENIIIICLCLQTQAACLCSVYFVAFLSTILPVVSFHQPVHTNKDPT